MRTQMILDPVHTLPPVYRRPEAMNPQNDLPGVAHAPNDTIDGPAERNSSRWTERQVEAFGDRRDVLFADNPLGSGRDMVSHRLLP